jgi:hypothetical protein
MPSKTPPTSIRLGKDRGARVDAYADEHGLKTGAAILALVDRGLSQSSGEIGQLPTTTPPPSGNRIVPLREVVDAGVKIAMKHTAPPTKRRWNITSLPLGPIEQTPGSRHKGNTPKRRG